MNLPLNSSSAGRLVGFTALAVAVAFIMPASVVEGRLELTLPIAVLVGLVLAVLLNLAATRRSELHGTVYLELNKLRRIYHLSKNMAATSQTFRSWFTDLHGLLLNYLGSFSRQDLNRYKESNAPFRKLSYHIYTIPDLASSKEQVLYEDLLETTSIVAGARQRIKELLASRLSSYVWLAVGVLATCLGLTVLAAVGETFVSRLAAGAELAALAVALDLLWEADALSSNLNDWAKRYVDNIAKLEYRRGHGDEKGDEGEVANSEAV